MQWLHCKCHYYQSCFSVKQGKNVILLCQELNWGKEQAYITTNEPKKCGERINTDHQLVLNATWNTLIKLQC